MLSYFNRVCYVVCIRSLLDRYTAVTMKVAYVYGLLVQLILACGGRVLNSLDVVTPAKGDVLVTGR